MTVNLLDLVNGVREDLGLVDLEAGAYTQMRLIIGQTPERNGAINILSQAHPYANYVVDLNDDYHELKVPSGSQSGYKIVGGFDINTNSTTELILDFDANRSVVEAGNSGQWLLKPTVKIAYLDDDSIIQGRVTDSEGRGIRRNRKRTGLHSQCGDERPGDGPGLHGHRLERVLSAVCPGRQLQPGGVRTQLRTPSRTVTVGPGTVNTENFTNLSGSGMGTFTGSVTITGTSGDEQYATLSFRTTLISGEKIEVYSINIRDTNSRTRSICPQAPTRSSPRHMGPPTLSPSRSP